MVVEIDKKSGFCFGVQNAVGIAEEALSKGERVFSLGPIVHNDKEVERLSALGLVYIDHDEFNNLKDCKVLIRAHGEPPETYLVAKQNNITIIEATCPIVRQLQSRILDIWKKSKENRGQIVIFGKSGHSEVVGLLGQTENEGILISTHEDLHKIDITRPVWLFAQTTMSKRDYAQIAEMIRSKMKEEGINDPDKLLHVNNTICGQVSNRESHLRSFAEKHDILIFVSGRESSNGKMLYAVCKNKNHETYFVSSPEEINVEWFKGKKSVGVCGATSTPKWLIEKVYDFISTI
ncbi:MAG: 4-hydroxy-3-methylbut-2-enyl diphosphate reductase [Bacteroidota bacterium]|nr:4-hydroxy-3-methylbut-2-enyl diphosphate reductase [Bacteroidota bacterium]